MELIVKNIGVAFYKGNKNWYHKIIGWWTKSCYSHSELVLRNDCEETWLSISPYRSDKKVSIRDASDIVLEDWDILEIQVTEEQYENIIKFYDVTKGCGYDWVGMIASQLIPFSLKRKNKWYCSEWVSEALLLAGVLDWKLLKKYERTEISPSYLHKIVSSIESPLIPVQIAVTAAEELLVIAANYMEPEQTLEEAF